MRAWSSRFCSAAPDVDAPFGALSDFFCLAPLSGAFVANPPFEPAVVLAMARRMGALLDAADAAHAHLSFIVVMPRWADDAGWRALCGATHATAELTLPRSKHAFVDGGQHYARRALGGRSGAPLRLSNHDSSMIFLQSRAAAAVAPVTPDKQRQLLEAFRGQHGS